MQDLVSVNTTPQTVPKVQHNKAPAMVAFHLFGITKWANEQDMDIVIHLHFNDQAGRKAGKPGYYSGFSIYVPAGQYGNSETTRAVATAIFNELAKTNQVSTLPGESSGLVDEEDLIAIGVDNTANAASLLIEYAYIYEPSLANAEARELAFANWAGATYQGLQDFFKWLFSK